MRKKGANFMNVKEIVRFLSTCSDFEKTDVFFKDRRGRVFPIMSFDIEQECVVKGKKKKKKIVEKVFFSDKEGVQE